MTTNSNLKKLNRKDLMSVFWRSCHQDASWNYERQQNLAAGYTMCKVIKKLYADDEEARSRALQRHLEFMAITPHLSTLLYGILAAMEEENANNKDFDENSINAVRASLMGPLAGIGDTLRQGTLIPIIGSIAISIGQEGNLLGPIFYFFVTLALNFGISYTLYRKAYDKGRDFVGEFFSGGKMEKIMTMVTAMGSITIGALAATTVKLTSTAEIALGDKIGRAHV